MDLSRPYYGVAPGLHGRVLVALADALESLSGREVARRAAASARGTARVLDALCEQGLVQREERPPAAAYLLNRQHLLAPVIDLLSDVRGRLFARITDRVEGWLPTPENVTMFGSAARGDGGTSSDIDLLVVRPDEVDPGDERWNRQVTALGEQIVSWTGNAARVVEYSSEEVRAAAVDGLPLIAALLEEGVHLSGVPLRTLSGSRAVPVPRSKDCAPGEARARLRKARDYLELAEVALAAEKFDPAAGNAVLAGIAAADAACCVRLKRRSSGDDHEAAARLLRTVDEAAATDLTRLLGVKYKAQYDHRSVTKHEAEQAVWRSQRLLALAERVLTLRPT